MIKMMKSVRIWIAVVVVPIIPAASIMSVEIQCPATVGSHAASMGTQYANLRITVMIHQITIKAATARIQ